MAMNEPWASIEGLDWPDGFKPVAMPNSVLFPPPPGVRDEAARQVCPQCGGPLEHRVWTEHFGEFVGLILRCRPCGLESTHGRFAGHTDGMVAAAVAGMGRPGER